MELDRSLSASPELRSDMMQEVSLDREEVVVSRDRSGSMGSVMAPERFSIIDSTQQADTDALAKVQGQLRPQGIIATIVDTIWNRGIAAIFSSEQRQLNAARDLLAKPTEEVTTAINQLVGLNAELQRLNETEEDLDIVPITLDNVEQYTQALSNGQVLVKNHEGQIEAAMPRDQFFALRRQISTLSGQLGQVSLGSVITGSFRTPALVTAGKAVAAWRDAIQTAGKDLSDAEFRGLVTQANANAVDAGANKAFVESNTVTAWAQVDSMGQRKFVNETAQEFTEAVKGIDSADHDGSSVTALIEKVDARAAKIAEITQGDTEEIKEALLTSMNAVPGFKEALMEAQDSLKTVVQNNQSHEFLAREQMTHLAETQDGVIDSVKSTIEGSQLKGEAAIVGTFGPLLFPEATAVAMGNAGRPDLLSMGSKGPEGQFVEVAKAANTGFNGHQEQLQTLLTNGNRVAVVAGQERADAALRKLGIMNELISDANKDAEIVKDSGREWAVDVKATNRAIEDMSAGAVAHASRDAFLTMIEKLAGNTDAEASPTLLAALLGRLGEEGQQAVLGRSFNPEEMFVKAQTDRQDVTYEDTTMLQFAGQRPESDLVEDERPITALRGVIGAIREQQAEARRLEQEEAMERAREERLANPTTMDKVGNFFRGLFASSPASEDQVDRSQTVSIQDLDQSDYFEDLEVTPEPSFGTKVANFFRGLNPFGSKAPVEPEHRGLGVDFDFEDLGSSSPYGTVGEFPRTPHPQARRRESGSFEEDLISFEEDSFIGQQSRSYVAARPTMGQAFDLTNGYESD